MWNNFAYTTYSVLIITTPYVHILYYAPYTQPLSFSNFFHSLLIIQCYSRSVFWFWFFMLKYFAFMFVTHHNLMAFFLLYLIFNIRFNFCITMLVYLNAVRPKHRPCLSLQRKIDMVFVPTNIVRSFFLLHFLNLLLFIHVHFYYSIFFDHTLHVPHIDTRVELIFLVLVFPALVGHILPSFQSLKN